LGGDRGLRVKKITSDESETLNDMWDRKGVFKFTIEGLKEIEMKYLSILLSNFIPLNTVPNLVLGSVDYYVVSKWLPKLNKGEMCKELGVTIRGGKDLRVYYTDDDTLLVSFLVF